MLETNIKQNMATVMTTATDFIIRPDMVKIIKKSPDRSIGFAHVDVGGREFSILCMTEGISFHVKMIKW